MNTNRIFIGTIIKECKEVGTSVFLKVKDEYILLNDINNIFDLYSKKSIKRFKAALVNSNNNKTKEEYYINKDSIIPYYEKKSYKSLRKIKDDFILDSRNPVGKNY